MSLNFDIYYRIASLDVDSYLAISATIPEFARYILKKNPNFIDQFVTKNIHKDMITYKIKNKFHRINGPAIEYANGNKFYYQRGKLHRIDGPAKEWADGSKCYYQYGELHRIDGPAEEFTDGTKLYYQYGKLYRTNGPAVEWANGSKKYY